MKYHTSVGGNGKVMVDDSNLSDQERKNASDYDERQRLWAARDKGVYPRYAAQTYTPNPPMPTHEQREAYWRSIIDDRGRFIRKPVETIAQQNAEDAAVSAHFNGFETPQDKQRFIDQVRDFDAKGGNGGAEWERYNRIAHGKYTASAMQSQREHFIGK